MTGSTFLKRAGGAAATALALALAAGPAAAAGDAAASRAAFERVARTLQHPRCLNCHQPNVPLQGDSRRLHQPLVQRGPGNMGVGTMQCSSCHNFSGNNDTSGTPGAPTWSLAPLSMNWQGLSVAQLCRQMKDRRRNGNRGPDKILEHMAHDELVGYGWHPGAGREPVPTPRETVVADLKIWMDGGMACPR